MKYFIALCCLLVFGCADNGVKVADNPQPGTAGKIAFALSKSTIPQNIASLTFTLTNLSTSETVSKTLVVSSDTLMQVEFDQLAVGAWHVKVEAKDSTSGVKYSGESDANVIEGQTTQLSLSLNAVTSGAGTLVITVTWPGTASFIDYQHNPVLSRTGSWYDIVGVAYPVVLADSGKYKMWFMNYGRVNGEAYGTIGLAVSDDGTSWTRVLDVVMAPTAGAWDSQIIVPGTVLKENGVYTMYYFGHDGNTATANIGMATSQDGIHWTKRPGTIIPNAQSIAGAGVVKANGKYYLYYNTSPSSSVYLATSDNGVNWQKYPANPVMTPGQPWENNRFTSANVIYENNTFTMLYYDNAYSPSFALATSTDGITWTKDPRNPLFSKANTINAWAPLAIGYPFLVRVGNELRIYYTGYQMDGSERIGYAIKR